ncbi:MAG TPA: hypothetical protein ENK66_03480 [Arcobacter sp.]|nr:hypothetical protein [Arcobacter sp.]
MPWIWNDKTYWKRVKESRKMQIKVFLPLFIITFILWKIFLDSSVHTIHISMIAFMSAAIVYTFISIFKRFPNAGIPDTYSEFGKTLMYISNFVISLIVFIFILSKVIK